MNSMRWMILALALAGTPSCKKEKPVDPAPAATPTPTEAGKTADPGAEDDRGKPMELYEDPAAARTAHVDKGADMVAVGSSGKAKVIATGKKTIADSESYTVRLAAPDKLAKGAKGAATLEVAPKKGWHLNDEFPYKLTVTAPAGTKVAKPEQGKKDTVAFSREAMKWSIDFEASSAGDKAFTGKVKFAVCTETSCEPKKEELAFNVVVE